MPSIPNYDVYIFDCDGVILDSNQLKIDAMERALRALSFDDEKIAACVSYFSNNFGKSRFHHVDVFLDEILEIESGRDSIRTEILSNFSSQCKVLYLEAELTPGFLQFIGNLPGNKYVASGSEQTELRDIFSARKLDKYFKAVFGSPTPKADLIKEILRKENSQNALMIGDALSDLEAAKVNSIDFIFYSPFSNVKKIMAEICEAESYPTINSFE